MTAGCADSQVAAAVAALVVSCELISGLGRHKHVQAVSDSSYRYHYDNDDDHDDDDGDDDYFSVRYS